MSNLSLAPWLMPDRTGWEAAIEEWVNQAGKQNGLGSLLSVETLKERPWSVVRRLAFANGVTYFKACGIGGHHEPKLLSYLYEQGFPMLPSVLATDFDSGWLLFSDEGVPLRDQQLGTNQINAFATILTRYAENQIRLMGKVDELLGLGLPNRQVQQLPRLFDRLLDNKNLQAGLSSEDWLKFEEHVGRIRPFLAQQCGESQPLASLDHGDLHLGNVLHKDGVYRLIDWGDACVTHPFCGMMISLEATLRQLPSEVWEETAVFLRDAYLEPWQALMPASDLPAEFENALWLGQIVYVLNFANMLQGADERNLRQWIPFILQRLEMC